MVEQLYSKEGRSKVYISNLLGIDRKYLARAIKEYHIPEPESRHRLTKSTEKFLNRNRDRILKMIESGMSVTQIAIEFGRSRDQINRIIQIDEVLKEAESHKVERMHQHHIDLLSNRMDESSRNFNYVRIDGEEWRALAGYAGYEVSNQGRVRKYCKRYDAYYLLRQQPNANNGRMYVAAINDRGERKNLMVARLVAITFCEDRTDEKNTVNHIDGNVQNNRADNLEWMSQSENNTHSYRALHRQLNVGKKIDYTILYQGKYEFKTIAAFARFIGKSWSQASRYLQEPEKHDIEKIYHKKPMRHNTIVTTNRKPWMARSETRRFGNTTRARNSLTWTSEYHAFQVGSNHYIDTSRTLC